MLPPSEPLGALTALDPARLYLFAVGPRRGEALAVRLPGIGWLLVDCCRTMLAGRTLVLPQQALVTRFPAPIVGALLTHPHEDHVDGFADLVNALPPDRVMVSGCEQPEPHLLDAVEARIAAAASTRDRTVAQQVKAAAIAIRQWEARQGKKVTAVNAATTLWAPPVSVAGRAPDPTLARPLLKSGDLAARANELSAVLEIVWGGTRLVLGGDLPTVKTDKKQPIPIPTGWGLVMQQSPQLGNHTGLKVPHHASWAAMHHALTPPAALPGRAWVVTPLHKGSNHLPSLDAGDGLDLLLQNEPIVMLTREPRVALGPGTWGLAALRAAVPALATGIPVVNRGKVLAPAVPIAPLDAVWGVAFDDAGHVTARYRGAAAVDIVP